MRRKLPALVFAIAILLQVLMPVAIATPEKEAVASHISVCSFDVLPGGAVKSKNIVDDVLKETLSGKGNITSKYTLTADETLELGNKLLGSGYKEVGKPGSGVFEKAVGDQTHRFRIDSNSLTGSHAPNVPHVHVEILDANRNVIINNHIPFNN